MELSLLMASKLILKFLKALREMHKFIPETKPLFNLFHSLSTAPMSFEWLQEF